MCGYHGAVDRGIRWDGICSSRRAELEVNGRGGDSFKYDLGDGVAFTDLKPALARVYEDHRSFVGGGGVDDTGGDVNVSSRVIRWERSNTAIQA